jgi:hypothetical protein
VDVEWSPPWTSVLPALVREEGEPTATPPPADPVAPADAVELRAVAAEPLTAHEDLRNASALTGGCVAIVQRGAGANFAQKVARCVGRSSGGVAGVIVVNNDEAHPDATLAMGTAPLSTVAGLVAAEQQQQPAAGGNLKGSGEGAVGTVVRGNPSSSGITKPKPATATGAGAGGNGNGNAAATNGNYQSPVPVTMVSFADGTRLLGACRSSGSGEECTIHLVPRRLLSG